MSHPLPQPLQQLPRKSAAAVLAEKVRELQDGVRILTDWYGDKGLPVANKLAQQRADACAKCPLNAPGNWMDSVTSDIAEYILEQRRLKTHMDLTVSNEEALGTCRACGCHLPLKIWVPLDNIVTNSSDETLRKLDERCWILNEELNEE